MSGMRTLLSQSFGACVVVMVPREDAFHTSESWPPREVSRWTAAGRAWPVSWVRLRGYASAPRNALRRRMEMAFH